jgi:hypothetical protein
MPSPKGSVDPETLAAWKASGECRLLNVGPLVRVMFSLRSPQARSSLA